MGLEKEFRIFIGVFLLIVFGVPYFTNWYSEYQCESYQKITGTKTIYNNWDQCYVNTPVGYQRWDEYKARAIASEGLKK